MEMTFDRATNLVLAAIDWFNKEEDRINQIEDQSSDEYVNWAEAMFSMVEYYTGDDIIKRCADELGEPEIFDNRSIRESVRSNWMKIAEKYL